MYTYCFNPKAEQEFETLRKTFLELLVENIKTISTRSPVFALNEDFQIYAVNAEDPQDEFHYFSITRNLTKAYHNMIVAFFNMYNVSNFDFVKESTIIYNEPIIIKTDTAKIIVPLDKAVSDYNDFVSADLNVKDVLLDALYMLESRYEQVLQHSMDDRQDYEIAYLYDHIAEDVFRFGKKGDEVDSSGIVVFGTSPSMSKVLSWVNALKVLLQAKKNHKITIEYKSLHDVPLQAGQFKLGEFSLDFPESYSRELRSSIKYLKVNI